MDDRIVTDLEHIQNFLRSQKALLAEAEFVKLQEKQCDGLRKRLGSQRVTLGTISRLSEKLKEGPWTTEQLASLAEILSSLSDDNIVAEKRNRPSCSVRFGISCFIAFTSVPLGMWRTFGHATGGASRVQPLSP